MTYHFKRLLLAVFFSLGLVMLNAQVITQISATWDDSLEEWDIYTDLENLEGKLYPSWTGKIDDWTYELGDEIAGRIKQTWSENMNSWNVISSYSGERVELKTVWKNDFSEWRITAGDKTYRLKTKYKSQPFLWEINQAEDEEFLIYMTNEGDPRDWIIEDYIEEGSLDLTIAVSFISILSSL